MWKGRVLGVDVGSSSIKLAQMTTAPGKRRSLSRIAQCDTMEDLAEILKDSAWWKPGDHLHLGFPADHLVIRRMKLPFGDHAKIQQTLPFELEGEIPFPVEEIVAGYVIQQKDPDGTELLALAAPREFLVDWLERFRDMAQDPAILEPEVTALARMAKMGDMAAGEAYGLLDLGSSKSLFLVGRDDRILFARCIRKGLGPEKTGLPLPDPLAREIQRTLWMARSSRDAATIQVLYLTGGGAAIPRVAEWLEARLKIPVQVLVPWQPPMRNGDAVSGQNHPAFNTAIGLALNSGQRNESCNLRVGEFAYRPGLAMLRGRALAAGILVLMAVCLGLADLFVHKTIRHNTLDAIQAESRSLFRQAYPGAVQVVNPALQLERLLEKRKNSHLNLLARAQGASTLEILREISLRVQATAPLRLKELDINADVISMRGEANSYQSIERAKERWESSPLIEQVEIKNTKKNPKTRLFEFQCLVRRKLS